MAFPPSGLVALAALLISCLSLCLVSCVFFFLSFFQCIRFLGYIDISPPQPGCPVGPFDLLFERLQVDFFWRTRVSSPGKIEYLQPNTKMYIQTDTFWPMWETSGWLFLAKKESLDLERLNIFKCLTTSSYLVRRSKLKMPITFLGYPSKNKKGKKIMISFGALWNS